MVMSIAPEILAQVKDTLLLGKYSLFLGSGASNDSQDRHGLDLPSSDSLRQELVKLKDLKSNSSLARAYAQLSELEVEERLTKRFSNCTAGHTNKKISEFIWSRVYTLNIDDALENAYSGGKIQQTVEPITHKTPYTNAQDVNQLQIIHVHGWARAPEDGYVFSLADYVGTMGPGSPWINVLAQTIATEPFIIAGTSLEEPDLEYFLAGRNTNSVRRDRGPSFLVEPYPDAATLRDCERHGLVLYERTLLNFLTELDTAFPSRPLPAAAVANLNANQFKEPISAREMALFSRNFTYVVAKQVQENADLGFYVGREPSYSDIALSRDVSRQGTIRLKAEIRRRFADKDWSGNFILVGENAGTGKTTILARTLYDLAGQGIHVFDYHNLSSPDINLCAKFFNTFLLAPVHNCLRQFCGPRVRDNRTLQTNSSFRLFRCRMRAIIPAGVCSANYCRERLRATRSRVI
jgi:hypothetical protein